MGEHGAVGKNGATDLIVRSRRVALAQGVVPATLHIKDGRIEAIAGHDAVPAGARVFDAVDALVMPGVVDTHVHVNEPGRTEWEGYASATRAAAAGGTTTLVDMPLNSIPATTSLAALEEKRRAARGQLWVDAGFWGGVVPGNLAELEPMALAGVPGFKCFLIDSGVKEFGCVGELELRPAMEVLARLGRPLLVHAELPGPIDRARPQGDPREYAHYLSSRPRAAEDEAVALMARLCRELRARVHIVHHSSSNSIALLREAKREGLPITAETCPHYLHFAAEDVPHGATEFKCAPPIRERANRDALWRALGEGVLDMVASDHSPCSPALKGGDFTDAWGGVAGLQLALPVTWTEASLRGYTIPRLIQWLCEAPARLAGLSHRKGALKPGYDADLVVWRPEETFRVEPSQLLHRHKLTPYAGAELRGVVEATFVRGHPVYERGETSAVPHGRELWT
jgi:allantoinase